MGKPDGPCSITPEAGSWSEITRSSPGSLSTSWESAPLQRKSLEARIGQIHPSEMLGQRGGVGAAAAGEGALGPCGPVTGTPLPGASPRSHSCSTQADPAWVMGWYLGTQFSPPSPPGTQCLCSLWLGRAGWWHIHTRLSGFCPPHGAQGKGAKIWLLGASAGQEMLLAGTPSFLFFAQRSQRGLCCPWGFSRYIHPPKARGEPKCPRLPPLAGKRAPWGMGTPGNGKAEGNTVSLPFPQELLDSSRTFSGGLLESSKPSVGVVSSRIF